MRDAALAAIAAAADLEALKQVRLEHAGDRSPLALANREIGALPPQARKEAGQRVGQARGAVNQALAARQAELEAEHEERMLVEETVDVTLPTDRAARRPAPAHHACRSGSPTSSWRWAGRSPRARSSRPSGSTSTRSTSGPTTRPAPCRTRSGPSRPTTTWCCAPTPRRSRPHDAHPRAADLRRLPRPGLPHRRVRRHAQPGVPPGRGPRRRRGHHHGPPQGHARPLRRGDVRRGHHDAVPAVVLPVHRAVRRGRPGLLRLPGRSVDDATPAAPAGARAGSSGAAAAWSTRGCSSPAASTPSATPASRSAWASTAR